MINSLEENLRIITKSLYDDGIGVLAYYPSTVLSYLPHRLRRQILQQLILRPELEFMDVRVRLIFAKHIIAYDDVELLDFYERRFNIKSYYSNMFISCRAKYCLRHMMGNLLVFNETDEDSMAVSMFTRVVVRDMMRSEWVEGMKIICNQVVLKKRPELLMQTINSKIIRIIFSHEIVDEILAVYCEQVECVVQYMSQFHIRISMSKIAFRWSVMEHTGIMTARCFQQVLRLMTSLRKLWSKDLKNVICKELFHGASISAAYNDDMVMLQVVLEWGYSQQIFPNERLFLCVMFNEIHPVNVEVIRCLLQAMHIDELKKVRAMTSVIRRVLNTASLFATNDTEAIVVLLVEYGFCCIYFNTYYLCMNFGLPVAMRAVMNKELAMRRTEQAIARSLIKNKVLQLRLLVIPAKVEWFQKHAKKTNLHTTSLYATLTGSESYETHRNKSNSVKYIDTIMNDLGTPLIQCPFTECAELLRSHYRLALM